MPGTHETIGQKFEKLVTIMERLRAPDGCPWDREQNHQTLKKYLIEESYELLEAIDDNDSAAITEECGDVLLQVVFHAQMAREEGRFDISHVIDSISNKLIRRHPHVFGDREAHNADEVLTNWEADKLKEKAERQSVLDGIAKNLPALLEADQIQKKVRRVGFDWETVDEVFDKVEEEWKELRHAREGMNNKEIEEELGDLLFAIANIARYLKIDPEVALKRANRKFQQRFRFIEEELKKRNKTPEESDIHEMDALWEEAKARERGEIETEVES